jgi:hypothetical protein
MTELIRASVPALRLSASRRAVAICALLSALLALAGLLLASGGTGTGPAAGARPLPDGQDLPLSRAELASARIGAGDPAYRMAAGGAGFVARNPVQRLQAHLGADGVLVAAGAARVRLQPRALGYGRALHPLPAVAPAASSNRALYARPGLSEWYANGPLGLEQGFLVPAPARAGAGPLTIAISIAGNLQARLAARGSQLLLGRSGRVQLAYGGLRSTDARGRSLRTWLQLDGGRLLLRVDARRASYPLRIDPVISTGGELTAGAEETEGGYFGQSIALTPDGNTLVVGAPRDSDFHGAAWVYARSGEGWSQVGGKLTGGSEEPGQGRFGQSVAISADGHTILIGAVTDAIGTGAAWVYTLHEGEWVQQGPKLTGGGEVGKGYFGISVALSEDGETAVIGGFGDSERAGAAWIFRRSGEGTWSQQGPKLTGAPGWFGTSVAISADGATVLVGAPQANGLVGAAYPFALVGGTWTHQGGPLAGGEEESGEGQFGQAVALSPDGNMALVGAPRDDGVNGAVWTFARSGGSWSQVGPKLTGDRGSLFGFSVALSPDGGTALIGGPRDHRKTGAVWEFTGSGGAWTLSGRMLGTAEPAPEAKREWEAGLEELEEEAFGRSVALSDDALVALIGAPRSVGLSGAVWQFPTAGPSALTESPTLVRATSATLRGSVNPEGRVLTDCHFVYAVGTAEAAVPCSSIPLPQTTPVPVSVHLTGLAPGVSYRVSLQVATASGSADGGSVSFTTLGEGAGSGGGGGGGGQSLVVLPFVQSTCPVTVASRTVTVRGRKKVQAKLLRPGAGPACTGRLRLVLRKRVKGHLRSTTIATGSFAFGSGQRNQTVLLKLTSYGRRALAGKGKPSLVLVIAGVPASSASVHVSHPKPPAKHH